MALKGGALRNRGKGYKELEVQQENVANSLTGVQTDSLVVSGQTSLTDMPRQSTDTTGMTEHSGKETSRQLTLPLSQTTTYSLSDGLAKITQLLDNELDKEKVIEAACLLKQLESCGLKLPSISLLKMYLGYSQLMRVTISTKQLDCLPRLGMTCSGKFLIQGGFSPRIESGYTLSDILEDNPDPKYFLSEKQTAYIQNQMEKSATPLTAIITKDG